MNWRSLCRESFSESADVLLLAAVAGLYGGIFYVAGNATMLPPRGMLIVILTLLLPALFAAGFALGLSKLVGLRQYSNVAALVVILMYVFAILRTPIFSIPVVGDFQSQLHGTASALFHLLVFLVPAVLVALIFRKNVKKLTIIFGVMSIVAVSMGIVENVRGSKSMLDSTEWQHSVASLTVNLDRRPNIYLIVPDSYGSMAYMEELGIDVSGFKAELEGQGFRFYEEAFSNYHPTLPSMLSTLNMTHHFYRPTVKESEVVATGRKSIGGDNALLRLLDRNGYESEYIHASNYLLLQGCTADICYPQPGARDSAAKLLGKVIPYAELISTRRSKKAVRAVPLAKVRARLDKSLESIQNSRDPHFIYVHIAEPGHPPSIVRGRCDEAYEHEAYAWRTGTANTFLRGAVGDIISSDPAAVIVLAGDHGPWIRNSCETVADLHSVTDYRDRMSALMAIRWPQGYAGEYDGDIKTPINVFRYILADLAEDNERLLRTVQPEDAFIQAKNGIAQILADGEIVGPPHLKMGE